LTVFRNWPKPPLAADEKRLQFSGGSRIFIGLRRWGAELKGK